MKFHLANDFNFSGAGALPEGDFVAVGIAPSSEVDMCLVGAHRLGPGQLVPFSTSIVPLRGYRSGQFAGDDAQRLSDVLVLVLYEKCDQLVAPGPRAAYTTGRIVKTAEGYATAPVRALRVPFYGRSQCQFCVRRGAAVPPLTGVNAIVRGLRYLDRGVWGQVRSGGGVYTPSDDEPHMVEVTNAIVYANGTVEPASTDQDVGGIFYVGGNGDNEESFDELELWVSGVEDNDLLCNAEATGERGR